MAVEAQQSPTLLIVIVGDQGSGSWVLSCAQTSKFVLMAITPRTRGQLWQKGRLDRWCDRSLR